MKNTNFVNEIPCPYCNSNTLKLVPTNSTLTEYYDTHCFCTDCGRSFPNIIKTEEPKRYA